MNLNDAFRTQNAISNLYGKATDYLQSNDTLYRITQEHNRKAVNPDGENETIEVEQPNKCRIPADDLILFKCRMLEEKEKLTHAIAKAKAALDFDFDAECALNAVRRELATQFRTMYTLEDKKTRTQGTDYKFNVAGDQTLYRYPVEETRTITYDKALLRDKVRHYTDAADEASRKLDLAEVTAEVDYVCPFSINDTFEDAVMDVLGKS